MKFLNIELIFIYAIVLTFSQTGHTYPRNWKYSHQREVTRCFENADVKVWCEGDDIDRFGKKIEEKVRELHIVGIDDRGRKCSYFYGKMLPEDTCYEHLKRIKFLMKDANQTCVTGVEWDESYQEADYRFVAFESKKGSLVW